jgi:hypothetical protein
MMRKAVLRAHVWLVVTLIPLLDRLLPLKLLLALMTPTAGWAPYKGVSAERIAETVAQRLRRRRHMRRRACLREGIALFHFLRLAGLPAALHIGVYPPDSAQGRLRAHCWVTDGCKAPRGAPQEPIAVVLSYSGPASKGI